MVNLHGYDVKQPLIIMKHVYRLEMYPNTLKNM